MRKTAAPRSTRALDGSRIDWEQRASCPDDEPGNARRMILDRFRRGCSHAVIVTAIGCLVSLLWGEGAQAVDGPPVAQTGQAVESQPNRGAEEQQKPTAKPTWPRSIVDAEKASRAECSNKSECRSEQRDYSDLRAQWQAADAAKGQQTLAVVQTVIAFFATLIAGFGTAYLVSTFNETKRTADAAIEANRLTREAFVLDQRPWIAVRRYGPDRPLTIDVNGCTIWGLFILENTGKTPALNVQVSLEAQVLGWQFDLQQDQARVAERARTYARHGGSVLFPGQEEPFRHGCSVTHEGIAARPSADIIHLAAVGCVSYCSQVEDKVYSTPILFEVVRTFERGFTPMIKLPLEEIPAEQLRFRQWPQPGRFD